ncbi:MAG: hypothetical protein Q9176_006200 [Flavoplaca citrina]
MNPQLHSPLPRESDGPRALNSNKPLRESSADVLEMEVESRHQRNSSGDTLYGTAHMAAEAPKPPSAGIGQKRAFEEPFPPAESCKKMKDSNKLIVQDGPSSLYKQKTCSKHRCAFGDLHSTAPWMIRNADLASALWSLSVQVDIGRVGMPCLKLSIHADKKSATMTWYANATTHDGALQVERFQWGLFNDWYINTSDSLRSLPAIAEAYAAKNHDPLIQIECDLQQPVFSDFEDSASWRTIPRAVTENFLGLLTANTRVSFLVLAKDKKFQ